MEGTRHERVVTVLSAYLIGFTTAFIAFGVTQIENRVDFVYVPTPGQTAAVMNAVPTAIEHSEVTVAYVNETGLMYNGHNGEVLISAYAEDSQEDGMHQSIFEFSMSPDGKYLYFCEVPSADMDACKPFVYVVAAEAVYPVTEGGERIALPLAATTLTWDDFGLTAISGLKVDQNPIR
jgi:hypothetical protein